MKIALVQPVRHWCPPFSLMTVGTALEAAGHEVRLFDGMEYFHDPPDDRVLADELGRVREFGPHMIGVGSLSAEWRRVPRILAALRANGPDAPILLGGRHPSVFPRQCLDAGADFVCVGEGERAAVQLAAALESGRDPSEIRGLARRVNGRVSYDGSKAVSPDLDALPCLDYSLVDYAAYVDLRAAIAGRYLRAGYVLTSRGCPKRCTFCHPLDGSRVRYRKMELVLDEIAHQVERYHIEALQITDDIFCASPRRLSDFCDGMRSRGLRVPFACQVSADRMTEDIAVALKDAGCIQLGIGIESGSEKMLKFYGKGSRAAQHRAALKTANRAGIPLLTNVMLSGVKETEADFMETVNLLRSVDPGLVAASYLTPLPGTALYDDAVRNGWIEPRACAFDVTSPVPELCVDVTPEELRQRMVRLYRALPRSMAREVFGKLTLREMARFVSDFARAVVKAPSEFGRLIVAAFRGDLRAAVNRFRAIQFKVRTKGHRSEGLRLWRVSS